MTSRNLWRFCLACGFAVLALFVLLLTIFPTEGADVAKGYGTPVIAFEMARTMEDLEAVFGPPNDPKRSERLEAMDAGNRWDYAFMVAYGGFILAFFLALAKDTGRRYWWIFAVLGVLAALADAVENGLLLELTARLASGEPVDDLLPQLPYPVWCKFFSLMLAGWGVGIYLLARPGGWKAAGFVAMLMAGVVSLGFTSPAEYTGFMGPAIGVVWAVQLVVAVRAYRAGGVGPTQDNL